MLHIPLQDELEFSNLVKATLAFHGLASTMQRVSFEEAVSGMDVDLIVADFNLSIYDSFSALAYSHKHAPMNSMN